MYSLAILKLFTSTSSHHFSPCHDRLLLFFSFPRSCLTSPVFSVKCPESRRPDLHADQLGNLRIVLYVLVWFGFFGFVFYHWIYHSPVGLLSIFFFPLSIYIFSFFIPILVASLKAVLKPPEKVSCS